MIDEFVIDSGLISESADGIDEVSYMVLSRNAECFLRSGGTLAMKDWFGLSDRSAFVSAGNRIMRDKAVLVGLASQSTYQSSLILAQDDDGEMMVRNILSVVLDSAQVSIESKKEVNL